MTLRNEKPIQHLLTSQTGELSNLREKVAQLVYLNKLLSIQLDPALIPHCRVANFKENCLIIEVASSAWSLRLRYAIPDLLKQLRTFPEFKQLKSIRWHIRSIIEDSSEKLVVQRQAPSPENLELIRDTAAQVSNEKLKRALQQLAETTKK